ncbi:MAG: hypothetical protein JW928_01175, partial [Candidatus Aureabacteria bacterium]|nr:hypothetical protein [Candidatus Auribacterota bacterium]
MIAGYFVSPHGFGHAARAASVMLAMRELDPETGFEIFTEVPEWFFTDSLRGPFGYHPLLTDIGLVQLTPLKEDLSATLRALDEFLPFKKSHVKSIADKVKDLGCRVIVSDISPLGLVVAREAGIPGVLVENFTWDWIYQVYAREEERLDRHAAYLKSRFLMADYHVQTEPVCLKTDPDITVPPISRARRTSSEEIRKALDLSPDAKVVMITMGGVPEKNHFLERLEDFPEATFLIPGGSTEKMRRNNLVLLPFHSDFFHPDLIHASDAVVGKAGYSTLAEVFAAGIPFAYIIRPMFRESDVLDSFMRKNMEGFAVTGEDYSSGEWMKSLPRLLSLPRKERQTGGAKPAAEFILQKTRCAI